MRKITSIFISTMFTALLLSACAPDAALPTQTAPPRTATSPPEPTFTPTPAPQGWVELETAHSPGPRTHHALALLPDGRVLLFGGEDTDGNALGDTWILDPGATAGLPRGGAGRLLRPIPRPLLEDWNQIDDPNAPEARFGHSMVTLSDGRVLAFGGEGRGGELFNDLHVFDGNAWERVIPKNDPPAPRGYQNSWVYEDKVYFQGGVAHQPDGSYDLYQDLWAYDPAANTWEQKADPPDYIFAPAGAYIPPGTASALLVDPHSAASWNNGKSYAYDMLNDLWDTFYMEPVVPPGERGKFLGYYNLVQTNGGLYLFGGQIWDAAGTYTYSNQVWQFDWRPEIEIGVWTRQEDMDMPSPLAKAQAVYDPERNRFIFVGGQISDDEYATGVLVYYPPQDSSQATGAEAAAPSPEYRVNPGPDEEFAVYCRPPGWIEIWQIQPPPSEKIAEFPIAWANLASQQQAGSYPLDLMPFSTPALGYSSLTLRNTDLDADRLVINAGGAICWAQ